jgi:hypothetical protein
MSAFTISTASTEWLRERRELLVRSPGGDFAVRGVSGAELNRSELAAINREIASRVREGQA